MSAVIEYFPIILFFIVYKFVDIFWATGVLIILSAVQMGFHFFKHGKVPTRHWIFFAIAISLGGMTILFQDEQFIKWKATIIYASLATALLISRYLFNKNLVKKALLGVLKTASEKQGSQLNIEIPDSVSDQLNLIWFAILMFIALLNIYIAYNFSLDFWVNFKVFGLMAITFVAIIFTIFKIHKYLPDDELDE